MSDHPETQPARRDPSGFAPAQWLRWLGALTFIGAGASYLVEGWTDPSIIKRQALWAAGTLILTVLGILVVRFRDARGGRVFLGLAAATIPAHFAQLGSALFDLRAQGGDGIGSVLVAGAIATLLLLPLALGMSALIRRRGRTLTALVFAFSLPLVISSRDPAVAAIIAGAQVVLWLALEATLFRSDPLFDSREGIAARLMLLTPPLIIVVRNGFHDTDAIWLASTLGYPALVLLVWPTLRRVSTSLAVIMQLVGVSGLLVALLVLDLPVLALGLLLSTVLLAGSELIHERPIALARIAAVLFALSAAFAYAEHGWLTTVAIIPIGTLHALAAYRRRAGRLFGLTVLASFAGALAHLVQLVTFPKHDVWLAGAILGVALLGLASLLESRRAQIQSFTQRLHHHFSE